jgi:hypothetical protein
MHSNALCCTLLMQCTVIHCGAQQAVMQCTVKLVVRQGAAIKDTRPANTQVAEYVGASFCASSLLWCKAIYWCNALWCTVDMLVHHHLKLDNCLSWYFSILCIRSGINTYIPLWCTEMYWCNAPSYTVNLVHHHLKLDNCILWYVHYGVRMVHKN